MKYKDAGIPLCILAGKEYGSGSSRDWAAKGPFMQGVKAVIAESYERIHRSNLIGMGILPLQFMNGESVKTLKLTGTETFNMDISDATVPQQEITVSATAPDGTITSFKAKSYRYPDRNSILSGWGYSQDSFKEIGVILP